MGLRGDHSVTLFIFQIGNDLMHRVFHPKEITATKPIRILHILSGLCFILTPPFSSDYNAYADPPLFYTDFSAPPDSLNWTGDLAFYHVDDTASPGPLRLNAPPDRNTSWLAIRESFEPVVWEWYVRQDFLPSNSNRAYFFLNAENPVLNDETQAGGLALRTGENGTPKHFRLIRDDRETGPVELLKSDVTITENTGYRIRIVRAPDDEIHLYIASGDSTIPLVQSETHALDESLNDLSGHFGFRVHYSTTRRDRFYFGDILLAQTLPEPEISEINVSGEHLQPDHDTGAKYASDRYTSARPNSMDTAGLELKVTFNVPPDSTYLTAALFELNDNIHPNQIHCTHPQICRLQFRGTIESGEHILKTGAFQTIYGQNAKPQYHEFVITDDAAPFDIIINEILYRPDNAGSPRFVEVMNRSNKYIDLEDLRLSRSLGAPVVLGEGHDTKGLHLPPNSKAVISEPGLDINNPDVLHIETVTFPSLSRFGDSVSLISSQGVTIDSAAYLPDWGGNHDGVSLERIDPDGASLDPANWRGHPTGHTAGAQNHHYLEQPELPETILAAHKKDNRVVLIFNRFILPSSLEHVYLEGRPLALDKPLDAPEEGSAASKYLFLAESGIDRTFREVQIYGLRDVADRENPSHTIPLAFQPQKQDLVFNEIMYEPVTDRYGSHPDQSEYIEIYNRSDVPLQLNGLYLHDRPDKNGEVRMLKPPGPDHAMLLPDAYALFYADTSRTLETARIYRAFSLPASAGFYPFQIDRLTLGLSTQGDEVYLSDQNGRILDSLWYHPDWHNPALPDTRGISLERIHPDAATMDPDNWTSNTIPEGGTPGQKNSVATVPDTSAPSGLKLQPNPFSPDGSGTNDHLIIRYSLDEPDYLLHVRIFDRSGRLVRTLADGTRAGKSGRLIWDGRTDGGVMNRTGIYIIHFTASNFHSGKQQVYREAAVLARSP